MNTEPRLTLKTRLSEMRLWQFLVVETSIAGILYSVVEYL